MNKLDCDKTWLFVVNTLVIYRAYTFAPPSETSKKSFPFAPVEQVSVPSVAANIYLAFTNRHTFKHSIELIIFPLKLPPFSIDLTFFPPLLNNKIIAFFHHSQKPIRIFLATFCTANRVRFSFFVQQFGHHHRPPFFAWKTFPHLCLSLPNLFARFAQYCCHFSHSFRPTKLLLLVSKRPFVRSHSHFRHVSLFLINSCHQRPHNESQWGMSTSAQLCTYLFPSLFRIWIHYTQKKTILYQFASQFEHNNFLQWIVCKDSVTSCDCFCLNELVICVGKKFVGKPASNFGNSLAKIILMANCNKAILSNSWSVLQW